MATFGTISADPSLKGNSLSVKGNADFDGDEMNMHVPQSYQTYSELKNLCLVPTQIISPQEGKPVIALVQDALLGASRLTLENVKYRTAINQLRISLAALAAALGFSIEDQLVPQKEEPFRVESIPTIEKAETGSSMDKELQGQTFYPFPIQLGAFKSEAIASSFLLALQKDFPSKTFETVSVDNWKKIRATQFTNLASAEAALAGFGGKGFIVHVSK